MTMIDVKPVEVESVEAEAEKAAEVVDEAVEAEAPAEKEQAE